MKRKKVHDVDGCKNCIHLDVDECEIFGELNQENRRTCRNVGYRQVKYLRPNSTGGKDHRAVLRILGLEDE